MKHKLTKNQEAITDLVKLLVYKDSPELFEKINFDDINVFSDPLLFSYLNNKSDILFSAEFLKEILQGYYIKKEKIVLNHSFNALGIAYIPQIGYFKKEEESFFTPIEMIKNTKIEILKYSHPLIDIIFKSASEETINDKNFLIDQYLFEKNITFITNAFHFIQLSSKTHFNLIEQSCKKCILFKTDPSNTNSFSTINAHGLIFLNVYQEDYDEVFFVDDIAHQTGHSILTTILFNRNRYFIIDENVNIGTITNHSSEYRSFYTLFHALFTYYTSLMCLDNCLQEDCFNKKQVHEAVGRIGFYINKLIIDCKNFEIIEKHFNGIENVITQEGAEIYNILNAKFSEIIVKWYHITKSFNYENQPYNFTYQEFIKLNPMPNA